MRSDANAQVAARLDRRISTSLSGRVGIPDMAVFEVEVDVNEVVLELASEGEDTEEGKAGKRDGKLGPEGVIQSH